MLLNSDKLASDYLNTTETETKLGDRVQKADIKLTRKQAWAKVKAEKKAEKEAKQDDKEAVALRKAVDKDMADGLTWKKNGKPLDKAAKRKAAWRVETGKDKARDYSKTK